MTQAEKEQLIRVITQAVVEILEKNGTGCSGCSDSGNCCGSNSESQSNQTISSLDKHLITERDVLDLAQTSITQLHVRTNTILTPLAKDVARSKNIAIIRGDMAKTDNRLDL
jgi:hypothetical protein